MKKGKISNLVFGLDIETSTIKIENSDDEYCSFMYSYCISNLDFTNGKYNNITMGRTYKELDQYLFNLNELAKENDVDYVIYIHNLSYEFSFFCNNLEFFKSNLDTIDEKNCLFLESNKPLFLKLDRLVFKCSYLLTGKSIKKLGDEIGIQKLDYNYKKLRTPLTKMTQKEIDYNYRDVEIMLKSVYKLFKNNLYMKSVKDIPLTKTGIMRFNCEQNEDVNVKTKYTNKKGKKRSGNLLRLNNYICHKEKAKDFSQIRLWQNLFQGGLVYSNPKYTSEVIENVASYDFKSDYPYQMLYRYFPSDFERITKDKNKVFKDITKYLTYHNFVLKKFSNSMFNCILEVKNIKSKFEFYPLSTSKIINIKDLHNMKNCTIVNGKIIMINTNVKFYMSCIDYLTLQTFYDFEFVTCHYLEVARHYEPSNKFKLNSVIYNATKKIEYSKYLELIENENDYKQYSESEICDKELLKEINNASDFYEQLDVIKFNYQNVKADLNALYGDNAQHLIHTKFLYDTKNKEWIKTVETFEDYKKARVKTSYIYGLYVPQYARASILFIAYKFLTNNLPVLYIDTDSIKTINCELAAEIVNDFNKIQINNLKEEYRFTKFGILEKEYVAQKFTSLGTKSYITIKNDKLFATISGLPNASKLYNSLLKYYNNNFEEMIENCYHYGVVFDSSLVKKTASIYNYNTYNIKVGNYKDKVVSGCVLKDVDVTMRDFTSNVWWTYAQIICNLYNKRFKDICFDVTINGSVENINVEF